MTDLTSRFIKLENWIFEIKSVRAIRVEDYGQPYDAIANIQFNGETAFLDGLITRESDDFSREDYEVFCRMCRTLGMKQIQFDRFKNNKPQLNTIDLTTEAKNESKAKPQLKLVR